MRRHTRSLLGLLVVLTAVAGCSSSDSPVTPRLAPQAAAPSWAKIPATDSMMVLTEYSFSDTANVLTRLAPLATDITASATIGSAGGTLALPAAGLSIEIPKGALSASTVITVKAAKGSAVAYEFGPHGTSFAKPVKIEQDLTGTVAATDASVLDGMYAGYFDVALDSAFLDQGRTKAKVKETQIGYKVSGNGKLRFSIGHFSGYLVSMGRSRTLE